MRTFVSGYFVNHEFHECPQLSLLLEKASINSKTNAQKSSLLFDGHYINFQLIIFFFKKPCFLFVLQYSYILLMHNDIFNFQ